ncbi:MerR family transcriptional regulator [Aeromicrobium sp. CTD01-1L150]|uniref:MerR family transcriptional regulator n=1 Tax=Aeromicrobium sp. CTD01-1L150 TaxID=3341830 RepID=UPI0035C1F43E
MDQRMKIGEVADRVGLSLRTIRFYEEAGLVTPDARSAGGFRLYTDAAVERLKLIRTMKPLDFTVEEISDVLNSLDTVTSARTTPAERREASEHLAAVCDLIDERVPRLLERAERGRELGRMLRGFRDQPEE